jgi:hypothetical protein
MVGDVVLLESASEVCTADEAEERGGMGDGGLPLILTRPLLPLPLPTLVPAMLR